MFTQCREPWGTSTVQCPLLAVEALCGLNPVCACAAMHGRGPLLERWCYQHVGASVATTDRDLNYITDSCVHRRLHEKLAASIHRAFNHFRLHPPEQ